MNRAQKEERVRKLEEMILKEAEEKARMMVDEVKIKAEKEKNKLFTYELERLQTEMHEREDQDKTQKRLERSRRINETRLEIQKYRNDMLEQLKDSLKEKLLESVKDSKKYEELLKGLIVQGLIRLLEKKVVIRCLERDAALIKKILSEVTGRYKKFMKEQTGEETTVDVSVFEKSYLHADEIGGVVLYCNGFKTVFCNTLKARIELAFQASIPDIRDMMFKSLSKPTSSSS
jgi:V-type H+-transporting ATPase subunit E